VGGVTSPNSNPHTNNGHAAEPYISDRLFTIPNLICWFRLIGSFVLVGIAWLELQEMFLWFFLFLAMTDWVDGKLAILLNQRSVFGARLDSWADAALYAALLVGTLLLRGETLAAELAWIIPAIVSYLISSAAGFWKYHRWPSYHTRAAKTGWFLIILGTIGLFTDWSLWPLRVAFAVATLTNLEALLITIISSRWRTDVTSIYHAWRDNNAS
jgi:CDP-diacylglycerol--glycerol-3-phosphate 3-phosphatidyltransferase